MTKHFGRLAAVALMLSAAIPFSAGAQTPAEVEAAKKRAAPPAAARPAPPPAAARPAPPPAAARPAPPPAAARPAPPPPAARMAPQRPQPPVAHIERPRREAPPAARIAPPSQNPAARMAPQRPDRERNAERPRRPDGAAPGGNRAERNRPAAPAMPNAAQRATPPAAPASPVQARQQQRQERVLQQREDRALRSLPPRQRIERREAIQRDRQDRAAQRQQATQPNARTGIAAQPDAASRNAPNARVNARAAARLERGPRRNGQARVDAQAARQGRFAGAFAASPQAANARVARAIARAAGVAPRRAWQSGRRASFVAWYGPVFYPYAYSDVFNYAFWPRGYDDDYWYVAYDDFFDGVFFGEVGQPEEYVGSIEGAPPRVAAAPTYKAVQDVCKQPGNGITAWPTAEIESKVGLNADQKQLLGDVKNAGTKAASVFRATCPSENAFPLTPTGRLASMTARLDATLEAVQTVRPALEAFYNSLNDEQKERFNDIGPGKTAASAEAREASPDAKTCGEAKPGLTNLPIEQIDDALKPNQAQQAELDKLAEATVKAVGILQNACPAETPLTPPGRLQAIETRLQAMVDAAKTVKPSLDSFYASLNAEQKARFNRLGRDLAQTTASSNQ